MKNINKPYYRSMLDVVTENMAENPSKQPKLRRNIDSSILDRFWDLVDSSDDIRLRAAEQLFTTLLLKQPQVDCFLLQIKPRIK